ncbi:kazal-type serine protease inhibitor domain-containing protein [Phthorimaea operculella]|nr:kazal-type serine protease inhibitor domain-containing protein [Phthorimaea operculella]
MIYSSFTLILMINVCVISAQPTTEQPEPETPVTLPQTRHRGQHYSNSTASLNCSACGDTVDLIVCGTDGKTYINECQFKCAQLENSDLAIKHVSVCEKDREGCSCTDDSHSQVCGADGKTYETKCNMWCENWVSGYGSTVQVAHDGPCKEQNAYLNDSNKPAHYKDTATRYNYASSRYNDAATRYNEAVMVYINSAERYEEKATHYNNAKIRHNYPKTRDEANQNIHDATHFIEEATRYIDEATRHISEATRRIDAASLHIDEHIR